MPIPRVSVRGENKRTDLASAMQLLAQQKKKVYNEVNTLSDTLGTLRKLSMAWEEI